ncbi:MAG TPA: GNAT family N-acetyltransferase [Candidatus Binatia bacterium]|nr:GNAT family N-acetyltransferase [Candidatus Binatia bacterium]
MTAVTIRPARPADEASLGRHGGALMRQHHAFDPRRFILSEHPESGYGRFLVSKLDDPDAVVLVAERDGEVIGYAYAGLEPMSWKELRAACGFVHDVYVDPRARRGGAGEQLMRAAIGWLEAKGVPRVMLWSAAGNVAAQRLFERLGFRHTMVEMTREAGTR